MSLWESSVRPTGAGKQLVKETFAGFGDVCHANSVHGSFHYCIIYFIPPSMHISNTLNDVKELFCFDFFYGFPRTFLSLLLTLTVCGPYPSCQGTMDHSGEKPLC